MPRGMENRVMLDVSVYIPCYNAEKYIRVCIQSILAQTYPIKEILVVNDGSTDRSMEIIRNEFPQVRIVEHPKNLGLACARNTGINNLNTEFIGNIDSDCLAEPIWLARLMDNFTESRVGGVGGVLLESSTHTAPDYFRAIHMCQHWGDQKIVNPPWLFGHSAVFRKTALQSVGGYREKFRTNYEDLDISRRLKDNGVTLVYEPSSLVHHLREDTFYTAIRTRWRWTALGVHGPVTPTEVIKNIGRNFGRSGKYLWMDLRHCRFSLLTLDFALGLYSTYADLRSLECR